MPKQPEELERLIQALQVFTVESDVFVDVFARAHDLGRNELNAIMWIAEGMRDGHPTTAGELASRLGLGAPATSALVDRLEARGHVRRARDASDRRKVTVEMQAPALGLAREFFEPLGDRMQRLLADVPREDLATAAAVVRRMAAAVREEREDSPRRAGS